MIFRIMRLLTDIGTCIRIGMKMKDPKPQFSYIVENIKKNHPDFAYIHVVEPRVSGNIDRTVGAGEVSPAELCLASLDSLIKR